MIPNLSQRAMSILRQIAAWAGLIFSVLTSAVSAIKLDPAESAILGAFGAGLLIVEHYVADPSTGTTTVAQATTTPDASQVTRIPATSQSGPVVVHAAPAAAQPPQSLP